LLALALLPLAAWAQDESFQLKLRRTFGYSWGSDIQGSFLVSAEGPAGLEQVTFHVDDGVLQVVGAPPFEARLHTGDFPIGPHRLWAKGTLDDGSEVVSNEILAEFVDPSAGWESAAGMLPRSWSSSGWPSPPASSCPPYSAAATSPAHTDLPEVPSVPAAICR